jgi:hypothetical protein
LDQKAPFNDRKFVMLIAGLIGTIIIDISVVRSYDLVDKYLIPLEIKLILFSINSGLCLTIEFAMIFYIRNSLAKNRLKSIKIRAPYLTSIGSLCVLAALFGILTFQQFYNNYYAAILTISIIAISYGTAAALISWLSYLFLSWYRSALNAIILLYFISILMIGVNLLVTGVYAGYKVSERPDYVGEFVGSAGVIYSDKSLFLDLLYRITSFGAFLSLWITTVILMNYYRNRVISSLPYWLVLSIPLVYFILTYFFRPLLSNLFLYYAEINPVHFTVALEAFLSLSKPIGGLVFGFAFWKISKIVSYERNIKTFMTISGWGIILIVSSNQGEAQNITPYPPFGLVTVTVLITAAFLMLMGIYNSATLVSSNNELRRTIHKHALESKLLDVIGRAEMENSIERTIKLISSDRTILDARTTEPADLDEVELKKYLDLVVKEVKKGDLEI